MTPDLDPVYAARMLANWGFLAHADLPDADGASYLLVALRDHPTLRHYDPEEIEYWVSHAGRGLRVTLTRRSPTPLESDFSWGLIRITDRLRVTNEYLTFGGRLRAHGVDDMTAAIFESEAPLLRRGGHSQGWDVGAQNLGAFFGRLRALAGYQPAFEVQASAARPLARYAAFLADFVGRYRASETLRALDPRVWSVLLREEHRMRQEHPAAWAAGEQLQRAATAAEGGPVEVVSPAPT